MRGLSDFSTNSNEAKLRESFWPPPDVDDETTLLLPMFQESCFLSGDDKLPMPILVLERMILCDVAVLVRIFEAAKLARLEAVSL